MGRVLRWLAFVLMALGYGLWIAALAWEARVWED